MTPHGVKDATTNEVTIRKWWRKYPHANVGIATGGPNGPIVLDVDPQRDGLESLAAFEKEHGRLPDGPEVRTGGDGFHLYLKDQDGTLRNRINVLPGVDVRGIGGYVVGAGSLHKSGKKYFWVEGKTPEKVALPVVPAKLRELIEAKPTPQILHGSLILEGQRNATLASLAGTMRKRGMTAQAIKAALLAENQHRSDPPLSDSEVEGIARNVAKYAADDSDEEEDEGEVETIDLKFRTGKQIEDEVPVDIPWIVRPYIAAGAITEIDGKVKLAGKTTFAHDFVHSVLDGSTFLGQPTAKTKVVCLTEQPIVSFRIAMDRAHLLGREDFTVLFWSDTIGTPWNKVAEATIKECKRTGAKLLIVDTLPQFAGLAGDSENNAGDALKALRPLQKAAAGGIAVVIVRHERKSGGAVGDSARGSSAIAGAVDVIVSLRRLDGNHPRNVRILQVLSRFENHNDLLIELTEDGYRSLGTPGESAKAQAAADLLSAIPKSKKKAATIVDLVKATGKPRAQVQKLLDALIEAGEAARTGKGHKGSPCRYFRT